MKQSNASDSITKETTQQKPTSRKRQLSLSQSTLSSTSSTLYPNHNTATTKVLFRIPDNDITLWDRIYVIGSSLFIIGSVVWVPYVYYRIWKYWCTVRNEIRNINTIIASTIISKSHNATNTISNIDSNTNNYINEQIQLLHEQKRKLYRKVIVFASTVLTITSLALLPFSPYRSPKFNNWIQIKKWNFLSSWIKFVAMEVIYDDNTSSSNNNNNAVLPKLNTNEFRQQESILAFVPHGIFPFGFGFGFVPVVSEQIFGYFRPVVATATTFVPFLRDILVWCNKIDASASQVNAALQKSDTKRIGINPGGIDEIFLSYPKIGTDPNTEYCIVRKGFLKLAYKYNLPVYPIYCFGATKMFRRFDIPFLEQVSHYLRTSIVLFYGVYGLPIPFRQKLMYVIGHPILAPSSASINNSLIDDERNISIMHQQFCTELQRMFEQHKEAYGWKHKSLEIISK